MDDVKKSDIDLILKKLNEIEKKVDKVKIYYEDFEFEKRTRLALKEIDEGKGYEKDFDEMKNW
jgi:hypothetical protein